MVKRVAEYRCGDRHFSSTGGRLSLLQLMDVSALTLISCDAVLETFSMTDHEKRIVQPTLEHMAWMVSSAAQLYDAGIDISSVDRTGYVAKKP